MGPCQTEMAGSLAPECDFPLLEEYFAWLKTVHPEKDSKLEDAVVPVLNIVLFFSVEMAVCNLLRRLRGGPHAL